MTEWEIGVLVLINLLIACGLFFYWRNRKNAIQNRYPLKKAHGKWLLFWLVGIWLVGIWSFSFIDYARYVSAVLVGLRLVAIWSGCLLAVNLWHMLEMKRIAGRK